MSALRTLFGGQWKAERVLTEGSPNLGHMEQWGLSSKIPLYIEQKRESPRLKGHGKKKALSLGPHNWGSQKAQTGPCLPSQFWRSEDVEQTLSWEARPSWPSAVCTPESS